MRGGNKESKPGSSSLVHDTFERRDDDGPGPGKRSLTQQLTPELQTGSAVSLLVQRKTGSSNADPGSPDAVHAAAERGTAGSSTRLPFADVIQRAFGRHSVGDIEAHTDAKAAAGAAAMGARAFATGNHVAFAGTPDLHTAAHEAVHVVQQRGGVQLEGGVGEAGDAYERHADAVADRAVAGRSAEGLLDGGATGGGAGATRAVQRKDSPDDAKILDNQANLKGTDVEIPALEGALLATRKEAVKRGLLSQAAFDAGLALSQVMTALQPAVAAKGAVDKGFQNQAAVAAQQLFSALQAETADDKNFKPLPSLGESGSESLMNPYTQEVRLTSNFLFWATSHDIGSWFQKLPGLIRQGAWPQAFDGYRRMLDGLDLWVADQLRRKGKGTPEEALGNAQQHHAQLRTGLEQIADKHATRLPAIFHPDPKTVEKEKAAGRPAVDAIPMNVYFWKDDKDGKFHLYDLTTPSRPHEQTIDGQPTPAALNTFFEEVARYPEGEVRFALPGGASGVAPTTGKTKWYEWVGYAGLAIAAVGLALLTAGASIPATVCFAGGALAGGVSAAGHLVDSARLGTATSATVVVDVAQIVASFASFGALNITVKAGGAAAALAGSRWFIPLTTTAAGADVVQLVALTDVTFAELSKIQHSAGSPEDQQRAMTVLLTQLVVMSGLTALSVQGARSARALAGKQLEIVEQNGVNVLRVVGEDAPAIGEAKPPAADAHATATDHGAHGPVPENHKPAGATHTAADAPAAAPHDAEHWLTDLEHSLDATEKAKLAKMKAGKTPHQVQDMLGADLNAARERVRAEVRLEQNRAAVAAQSKERVAELRTQIAERGLMNDPEIRAIIDGTTADNRGERLAMLRDKLVAKVLRVEAEHANPGAEVIDGVKLYEKLPEANVDEWKAKNPGEPAHGLTDRPDGLYIQRGEIDMMVVQRQPSGKATVIAREEIKTGGRDTNAAAQQQLDDQTGLLRDGAAGKKAIRLEAGGRDITGEIDLASAAAHKSTRGPAGKGFDKSLGASARDLEALCKDLLADAVGAGKGAP